MATGGSKDNADLVNHWGDYEYKVQTECLKVADKTANDASKYGNAEWPWLEYFPEFCTGDDVVKTGRIVAIEPNVRFPNAFNAKVRVRDICTYDLDTSKVVNVR